MFIKLVLINMLSGLSAHASGVFAQFFFPAPTCYLNSQILSIVICTY